MKKIPALLAILATTALAACGGPDSGSTGGSPTNTSEPAQVKGGQAPEASGEIHSATGDITGIDGNKVTIAHGPVEGIGWPAMTMAFSAGSPEMLRGLNVGDRVNFQFQESGSGYAVTSISRAK